MSASGGSAGRASVTEPIVPTYATMPAASRAPMANPSSDPTTPNTRAWASMNQVTWPRVAPAARSRPTSRMRSPTVIDRVLKMRNAPTNSAMAAIRAVVAWKSAVEARRVTARSRGAERTYGSVTRRLSRSRDTADVSAPSARPISTRVTPVWPNAAWAVRNGTTMVRPNAPVMGPSPARIPTTR